MTAPYLLGAAVVANIYDEYDFFAYFYNRYWMPASHKYFQEALELLLYKYLKKGDNILDLCCGTGHIAKYFEDEGFNVFGIDGSKAMLFYAEENAKKSRFYQMDARDFTLEESFKAITCNFDSINHILNEEDLLKVFKNVYNHLKDDGVFYFDILSHHVFLNAGLQDMAEIEDDSVFIIKSKYYKKGNDEKLVYNLTYFIKEQDNWNRYDSQIYEKYYEAKTISSLLKKAGFLEVDIIYGTDIGIEAMEDRIFFTVWK